MCYAVNATGATPQPLCSSTVRRHTLRAPSAGHPHELQHTEKLALSETQHPTSVCRHLDRTLALVEICPNRSADRSATQRLQARVPPEGRDPQLSQAREQSPIRDRSLPGPNFPRWLHQLPAQPLVTRLAGLRLDTDAARRSSCPRVLLEPPKGSVHQWLRDKSRCFSRNRSV